MGDVIIKNVIPTHMEAVSAKLMESGARVIEGDDGRDFYLRVIMNERPRAINVKTLPYPGFPTDLQQPIMAYLCASNGVSTINETIFRKPVQPCQGTAPHGRFHQHEGQQHREGEGDSFALRGADIYATDLRAGASLIVAGLAASGTTNMHNIHFIDRGYEYLEEQACRAWRGRFREK